MTKTTTTYALPDEPEGPVWDRHGDKWETGPGMPDPNDVKED